MTYPATSLLPATLILSSVLALCGFGKAHGLSSLGGGTESERLAAWPTQSSPDTAAKELSWGRPWHASRLLRRTLGALSDAGSDSILLLAEAEAGWGNWAAVSDLLEPRVSGDLVQSGRAWFLLGLSREQADDPAGAEAAYTRYLALNEGDGAPEVTEVRIRRARARLRGKGLEAARSDLQAVLGRDPLVGSWLALELAELSVVEGTPEQVRVFQDMIARDHVRQRGWAMMGRAHLAAGDSTAAEAAFWGVIPSLDSSSDQASAWERVGALRLSWADSSGAKGAFHRVLDLTDRGSAASRAGMALLDLGFDSASVALRGAAALGRAGRSREALEAYAIHETLLGEEPSDVVRLARARLHLRLGERSAAVALLRPLGDSESAEVGAPALSLLSEALRGLGRGTEARRTQDLLVETFPGTAEAVDVPFFRGDAQQSAGNLTGALELYAEAAALAPTLNRAGQSRMRMGQILLTVGREEEAVRVFQDYLADFPNGRRWDEAAFWGGRTLLGLGEEEEGTALLERVLAGAPFSYYGVQATGLLDRPYAPAVMTPTDTLPFPFFLREGLRRIDLLKASGLGQGAESEVRRLSEAARGDQEHLLRLALELDDRGFTREGINLGWELRNLERPWGRNLLKAIYPFPFRETIEAEARDWGLDPFFMAGLMRQESAFWAEAVSRADARGLMQVLPSTGRELARAVGPPGFRPDEHLFRPEVNLHLGMAFFSDLKRRFGEDPAILLAAYNAGPTRAIRWRRYPEAGDLHRFTETIPFAETRGYVKNVLRNRAIYSWLYGKAEGYTEGGDGRRYPTSSRSSLTFPFPSHHLPAFLLREAVPPGG